MVDPRRFAAVIAGGAAIGLALGWAIWGQPVSVPQRLAELMQERCLPYVMTGEMNHDGLQRVPGLGRYAYGDPESFLTIRYVANTPRCSVSDILQPVSDEDYETILDWTAEWAEVAIAPLNNEPLVLVDLTDMGIGKLQHVYRQPSTAEGYFLQVFTTDETGTEITIGRAALQNAVESMGGVDA